MTARPAGVTVHAEAMRELVDERVELEELCGGHEFTEGPIWNPDRGHLLFVDVPGNARHHWDPAGGQRPVARPSSYANGMTLDAEGRLIVCEHGTHSVVRMDPDGTGAGREVLVSHHDGGELNAPNDVIVAPDGSIYFTDPSAGRLPRFAGHDRPPEQRFAGVYRIHADGRLDVVADDIELPNGLCLSPDRTRLYVCDTLAEQVWVIDLDAGGSPTGKRVFAAGIHDDVPRLEYLQIGRPDGIKCDERGNVWVVGPGGVWVFDPDGRHLGTVHVPQRLGNLNFGGPDGRWLFVCSTTSVYRVVTEVRGQREPYLRG